jgi:hypothetical protein
VVDHAAAVSAPVDPMATGDPLGSGFNLLYTHVVGLHKKFPGIVWSVKKLAISKIPFLYAEIVTPGNF